MSAERPSSCGLREACAATEAADRGAADALLAGTGCAAPFTDAAR